MNWITIAWPMLIAACLTLGLVELRIGLAQPQRTARLLFSVSAFATAAFAGLELVLIRTDSVADIPALARAMNAVFGVLLVSLTAFIWFFFGTGNKWLAIAAPSLYAIGEVADFVPGSLMTYQEITGLRTVETFGGATFAVVDGIPNPWNVFPYLAILALIVFVADASVRLWRRGGRRRALVVGGSIGVFLLIGGVHAALWETGLVSTPYTLAWPYMIVLVAMVSELNADVLAAAHLAAQLRESERRIDQASAAANVGMWAWDIKGDTVWATKSARALFGFSEMEQITSARVLSAVHAEDREVVDRTIQSALASDGGYEAEYRVVPSSQGRTCWIASRGQVERDTHGRPILVRGVVLDISERRDTEMELQQLRGQLAHASRVSMLGQLASALAHELSQPLGAILRNTEAAELFLQHEPPDLEELRAILADIRQDDQRAGGVIERLRALLMRRSFAPRSLSVSDLLEDIAVLTRIDSSTRKAHVNVEPAAGLPAVMGDPVQLQQVLLNLVLNAIDAVEDAPIERRKVTVHAQRNGVREVEVAVSDSGHGIAPEKLERLFEPFFTTKPNGMGIGLSISQTIIQAHGGRIWAENNAGAGATFRFALPLAWEGAPS